mmetsp:Transcript_11656/g.31781  ORF Transcript_11656/g.31781 Transcript_11656/m.31781 type:complete len:364 (-) Transcript_11656:70-1161(-)
MAMSMASGGRSGMEAKGMPCGPMGWERGAGIPRGRPMLPMLGMGPLIPCRAMRWAKCGGGAGWPIMPPPPGPAIPLGRGCCCCCWRCCCCCCLCCSNVPIRASAMAFCCSNCCNCSCTCRIASSCLDTCSLSSAAARCRHWTSASSTDKQLDSTACADATSAMEPTSKICCCSCRAFVVCSCDFSAAMDASDSRCASGPNACSFLLVASSCPPPVLPLLLPLLAASALATCSFKPLITEEPNTRRSSHTRTTRPTELRVLGSAVRSTSRTALLMTLLNSSPNSLPLRLPSCRMWLLRYSSASFFSLGALPISSPHALTIAVTLFWSEAKKRAQCDVPSMLCCVGTKDRRRWTRASCGTREVPI